ncbi:hypothetical protein BCR34DRAFT_602155 [Clohesyomyces aquaticus]|uniref:Uncharacterized protein n=1 Tax=Clohesyomyces aquaticus TaxID=1231657 RepID=A0A1Y1ZJ78_9PLEO|nr:hypothetical protein BCR34DRAFT_602155 [Clohesyomyces aquaticus]
MHSPSTSSTGGDVRKVYKPCLDAQLIAWPTTTNKQRPKAAWLDRLMASSSSLVSRRSEPTSLTIPQSSSLPQASPMLIIPLRRITFFARSSLCLSAVLFAAAILHPPSLKAVSAPIAGGWPGGSWEHATLWLRDEAVTRQSQTCVLRTHTFVL